MRVRLEALPADILGLGPEARSAWSEGQVGGLPVVRSLDDVPVPEERLSALERSELVAGLRAGLAAHDPPSRVETSLRLLEEEGTACVVTGQQAGFLGGPLYTLLKALQACRLAADLGERWGRPVVPIFWNHGDDHDWGEVAHAWLLNRNQDLQKLALRPGEGAGRQPVSRLPLSDDEHGLEALRAAVSQAFEEHAPAAEAVRLLFPREGEALTQALTRTLTTLLGPRGLVVLEPDWVRPALARGLAHAVSADPVTHLQPGPIDPARAALAFRVDGRGRTAVRPADGGFQVDGEPGGMTGAELAALALDDPCGWSAGALLRPLVQDQVLPVAATVGGWGELAYHAQLSSLRDRLGLPRTPFAPRISATLVEPELAHALERMGASVRSVLEAGEDWSPPSAEEPEVLQALAAQQDRARAELLGLRGALRELEPALEASLKRTADILGKELGKLLTKVQRVHRNRAGTGEKQVKRIVNGLLPRGLPQERVWTLVQALAPHGSALVDALWEELPGLSAEHLVVLLPKEDAEPEPQEPSAAVDPHE